MVKLTALFTSLLIFMGSFFSYFLPAAPKPETQDSLASMSDSIKKKTLPDTVYAVDFSCFTEDEKFAVIALQGIVAKKDPCIYFVSGGIYESYLQDIERSGKKVIRTDENGEKWNFKSLVMHFRDYIGENGYVLYKNSDYAEGLNTATNFATAFSYLPVSVSVREKAEECGLVMKKDLTGEKYDYAFQKKYFRQLKKYFEKGTVVHIHSRTHGLRDLAISQGYYCFYTKNDTAGDAFLRQILRWSGKNTSVYGWCENEKQTVKLLSKAGCHINPVDLSRNCSYLSQFDCDTVFDRKDAVVHTDESKHYITLVFSDGDNCQWIQNGFGEYYTTAEKYPEAKITWTYSPVLRNFCPFAYERTAAAQNENTSFICGPSGFGYANPSLLDAESLDVFSTKTASSMLKSNQRVLTVLDDYSAIKEGRMKWSFGYFSRFDNIDGGILFLDPNKYLAGGGKVWFSNDKPFVSVRLSLWADNGYDGATDEWLKTQADTVNAFPADIHSINGYSVILIHAWSMRPASVAKFTGMLGENVEILSADDFIATVRANIPHETAQPD